MKNKFLLKVISSFLTFLIATYSLSASVIATDSITGSCSKYPADCKVYAQALGISDEVAGALAPSAGQPISVSAQVLSPTGQVLGTTGSGAGVMIPASNTGAMVFAGAGAGVGAFASASAITSLRSKARANYCQSSSDSVCGNYVLIRSDNNDIIDSSSRPFTLDGCFWSTGWNHCNIPASQSRSGGLDWSNWPPSSRAAACNTLTINDYKTEINDESVINIQGDTINNIKNYLIQQSNNYTTNVTNTANDFSVRINIGGGASSLQFNYTGGAVQVVNQQNFSLNEIDNYFQTSISNEISQEINNINNQVSININSGTTTNNTTITNPDGTTTIQQSEGTFTIPEPQGNIPNPTCPDINCENRLTRPNFISYGIEKLSNKFPFDILGDISLSSSSSDCPIFSMYEYEKEICVLRHGFQAIKYGVWSGFVVHLINGL